MSKEQRLADIEYCVQRLYKALTQVGLEDYCSAYIDGILSNAKIIAKGGE